MKIHANGNCGPVSATNKTADQSRVTKAEGTVSNAPAEPLAAAPIADTFQPSLPEPPAPTYAPAKPATPDAGTFISRTAAPETIGATPDRSAIERTNREPEGISPPADPATDAVHTRVFSQEDFDGVLKLWGKSAGDKDFDGQFDVNGDGRIDIGDLAHIIQNLPASPSDEANGNQQ